MWSCSKSMLISCATNLGEQDVGAAGRRCVAEARVHRAEPLAELVAHHTFQFLWEAWRTAAGLIDHVSGEYHDLGNTEAAFDALTLRLRRRRVEMFKEQTGVSARGVDA